MTKSKTASFYCSNLGRDVTLHLVYAETPGGILPDQLTNFDCESVGTECGIMQDADRSSPTYNWDACPARNHYNK
jgi:hypothetical protein